jgi:hypothetical protein
MAKSDVEACLTKVDNLLKEISVKLESRPEEALQELGRKANRAASELTRAHSMMHSYWDEQ